MQNNGNNINGNSKPKSVWSGFDRPKTEAMDTYINGAQVLGLKDYANFLSDTISQEKQSYVPQPPKQGAFNGFYTPGYNIGGQFFNGVQIPEINPGFAPAATNLNPGFDPNAPAAGQQPAIPELDPEAQAILDAIVNDDLTADEVLNMLDDAVNGDGAVADGDGAAADGDGAVQDDQALATPQLPENDDANANTNIYDNYNDITTADFTAARDSGRYPIWFSESFRRGLPDWDPQYNMTGYDRYQNEIEAFYINQGLELDDPNIWLQV